MGNVVSRRRKTSRATIPSVSNIPRGSDHAIDFSHSPDTPRSRAEAELLSLDTNRNTIALVGMEGSGKTTTLLSIARSADISRAFSQGIWLIRIFDHMPLRSFILHLRQLAHKLFPDFLDSFDRMTSDDQFHSRFASELLTRFSSTKVLLIFDDVLLANDDIYNVIDGMCSALRTVHNTHFKILLASTDWKPGRRPMDDVTIDMNPVQSHTETAKSILCFHSCIDPAILGLMSRQDLHALDRIISACGGMPLALSIAGSSIRIIMNNSQDDYAKNAIKSYWGYLQHNVEMKTGTDSVEYMRLYAPLTTGLQMLQHTWPEHDITFFEMFRSFCILRKKTPIPLRPLEMLWRMKKQKVADAVSIFASCNMVSLVRDEHSRFVGLDVHDLIHDFSARCAESEEGVHKWHSILLDAYCQSFEMLQCREKDFTCNAWWNLTKKDSYMQDNVVRHLLGAGRINQAVALVTDYRWIQRMNRSSREPPFAKLLSDMKMVERFILQRENCETSKNLSAEIALIMQTVELCMVPYGSRHYGECTFQLYGRLVSLQCKCNLVDRMIWSIEHHARRPWVRAGSGVLKCATLGLKRVLPVSHEPKQLDLGLDNHELIISGVKGELRVVSRKDGSEVYALDRYCPSLVCFCVDRNSGDIIGCTSEGNVTILRNGQRLRAFKVRKLNQGEKISCMLPLAIGRKLVVGCTTGRMLILDASTGNTVKVVVAHTKRITSLTTGVSEKLLISASQDRSVQVWNTSTFQDSEKIYESENRKVTCVALSRQECMIALALNDGSVRVWAVEHRREIYSFMNVGRSSVHSIRFNADSTMLYAGCVDAICRWDMAKVQNGVAEEKVFTHDGMGAVQAIQMSEDGKEIMALGRRKVFVWETEGYGVERSSFLNEVRNFAVSADDEKVATFSASRKTIEIRHVADVAKQMDRVNGSFQDPDMADMIGQMAVSNDHRFVAYAKRHDDCNVYVIDLVKFRATVLGGLQQWAEATSDSAHKIHECRVVKIAINASDIITAHVTFQKEPAADALNHSISWMMSTGEQLPQPVEYFSASIEEERTVSSRSRPLHLSCEKLKYDEYSSTVEWEDGSVLAAIATLEFHPWKIHFSPTLSRLWVLRKSGGLHYVDLVAEDTQLPEYEQPKLFTIPENNVPNGHAEASSQANKKNPSKVTAFISHAGPDKHTLAVKIYKGLKKLDIATFIDLIELNPGDDAPQKMIENMESAEIFIIIVSPEFPARKWTMMELMCALRRYDEAKRMNKAGPLLIPIFYRLNIEQCRSDNLFDLIDEHGVNVFSKEGFFERLMKNEVTVQDVSAAMKRLSRFTGIENVMGLTNCTNDEHGREIFAEQIVDAVEIAINKRGKAVGVRQS